MFLKIINLFSYKEKIIIFFLLFFISFGALLEIISIAFIVPFTSLLLNNTDFLSNKFINFFFPNLINIKLNYLIFYFGFFLCLIFLFKNTYLLIVNFIAHRFIYTKYQNLGSKIFEKYLKNNYEFHLKSNSSILQRNINTEVFLLITNILIPSIMLVSEVIVVLSILTVLLFIELLYTIYLITFFSILFIFISRLIKVKLLNLGASSQFHFGEMIKNVNQSLGSIKLTKVSNKEDFFLHQFKKHLTVFSNNSAFNKNITQWPRYFTEVLVIIVLVFSSLFFLSDSESLISKLPILSFFALAAFRLMPSFNRILSSYNNIAYYSASLEVISNELFFLNKNKHTKILSNKYIKKEKLKFNEFIKFDNISFNYLESKQTSIQGFSVLIQKGERVGLIGKSGSGKTTIIDILIGLLKPSTGQLFVDGIDINSNLKSWQDLIGYVPQNIYLLDDTIKKNIAYGISENEINNDFLNYAIDKSELREYVNKQDYREDTIIGENGIKMSGGERQRIGIARALYLKPKLLIFDEGTSSLDNETQKKIIKSIYELDKDITIIIIAHRLDILLECDNIYLIQGGKLKSNISKQELIDNKNNLENFIKL